MQNTSDVIVILDAGGVVRYVSPSVERVLGYRPEEQIGAAADTFVHPEDRGRIGAALLRVAGEPGTHPPIEFRLRHADGSWRHCEAIANNLLHVPSVRGIVQNVRDITPRRQAEAALLASEQRFRSLVQNATDLFMILDADGAVRYISPSAERVLGFPPDELAGLSCFRDVHPDDLARARTLFEEDRDRPGISSPVEVRVRHRDGSWRYIEAVGNNLLTDPSVRGIVVNARDVTERKLVEEQLERQAFHDPLTGLPNRALFLDRLGYALARARRQGDAIAVMFLDLDRFKVINDSLGHGAGDVLLAGVGRRLAECLRPGDTVSRFGGDEFTVLVEDVVLPIDAIRVADRITAALGRPFTVDGHEVYATASIGIVLSAPDHVQPVDLLRDADVALYQAKAAGRARFAVFDASMNVRAVERLDLETDLQRAVERGELVLHYQPEVDLATAEVAGMEALARWNHPRHGLMNPADFIPLTEETGLIFKVGRWVLEEACRQACAWQTLRPPHRPLIVSVNLSARQFQQPDLAEQVARVLRETGLDPACLRLEITESAAMQDAESTVETLRALRGLGVLLAIDDFGTGYSSLSYLRRFAVDTLKVDRSFVEEIASDRGAVAIVQAVTTLAHALGMDVTIEGIETVEQLASAWAVHCDRAQGFYFARPLPGDEMERVLLGGLHCRYDATAG